MREVIEFQKAVKRDLADEYTLNIVGIIEWLLALPEKYSNATEFPNGVNFVVTKG